MPHVDTSIDHATITKMQKQVEALEMLEGLLMRRREITQSIIRMNAEWTAMMPVAAPEPFTAPRFLQRHG